MHLTLLSTSQSEVMITPPDCPRPTMLCNPLFHLADVERLLQTLKHVFAPAGQKCGESMFQQAYSLLELVPVYVQQQSEKQRRRMLSASAPKQPLGASAPKQSLSGINVGDIDQALAESIRTIYANMAVGMVDYEANKEIGSAEMPAVVSTSSTCSADGSMCSFFPGGSVKCLGDSSMKTSNVMFRNRHRKANDGAVSARTSPMQSINLLQSQCEVVAPYMFTLVKTGALDPRNPRGAATCQYFDEETKRWSQRGMVLRGYRYNEHGQHLLLCAATHMTDMQSFAKALPVPQGSRIDLMNDWRLIGQYNHNSWLMPTLQFSILLVFVVGAVLAAFQDYRTRIMV